MRKSLKLIAKCLLFMIFILGLGIGLTIYGFFDSPAMAEKLGPGGLGGQDSIKEQLEDDGVIAPTDSVEDQGSTVEKLVSLIPQAIIHALMALGLKSIPELIFQPNNFITQDTIGTIWDLYRPLFMVGVVIFAAVLAWLGATFGRSKSAQAKANASEAIWRWLLGFTLLFMFIPMASFLFEINNFIVSLAAQHSGNMDSLKVESTGSFLATALVNLYIAGLQLYFNILYVIREVFIIFLVTVSPLVIWTFVVKPAQQSFLMLFGELFSNIMMQASHALAVVIVLLMWENAPENSIISGWWAQIVLVTLIIPIGQFLRNLINVWLNIFGLQEERLAMGATGGIGAALALPKIIGGMAGLKFGSNAGAGGAGGGPGDGSPLTGESNPFQMGNLSDASGGGSSTASLAMASGSQQSPGGANETSYSGASGWKWGTAYNVAAKGAAVAGGIAGLTMGLPIGQQQAGMAAGSQFGRRIASNIGQSHQYMREGYKNDGADSPSIAKGLGTLAGGASGGFMAGKTTEFAGKGIEKVKGSLNPQTEPTPEQTPEPSGSWQDYIQGQDEENYQESVNQFVGGLETVQASENNHQARENNTSTSVEHTSEPQTLDDQYSWGTNQDWPSEDLEKETNPYEHR
ncbi:MAG: hypothetical protein FH756_00230 [Firmicutes bacterium]|nr:hypothetical protein [Bacillota bacterium]